MIKVWVDGGCPKPGAEGGWGVVIDTDGVVVEYSGSTAVATNNTMELTAAIEGLKQTPIGSVVELTTDSNYVVGGMTKWIPNWKRADWKMKNEEGTAYVERPNKKLWQALDLEASKRKVTWKWVRGHNGHEQNERCDALASKAIKDLKEKS